LLRNVTQGLGRIIWNDLGKGNGKWWNLEGYDGLDM